MGTIKRMSLASVFLALLILSACHKTDMISLGTEETIFATDNARMDNELIKIDDVTNSVAFEHMQAENVTGINALSIQPDKIKLPACAEAEVDLESNPHTLVVDFGSSPCLCDQWDGRWRQGKIMVTWTGNYFDAGTVLTVTTENFYRGDSPEQMNKYDIQKTVTSLGTNQSGNFEFHVVEQVDVTFYTGETAMRNIDKIKEWAKGENNPNPDDNIILITGTLSGINRNGVAFTEVIATPLMKTACDWFVKGVIEMKIGDKPLIILDYGDGICDNLAKVTVNGESKLITLK